MSLVNVPTLGNPDDLRRQLRSETEWSHSRRRGHSVGRHPVVGVPREYSRSREEQYRERRNASLPRPPSQRERPQSLNSSISAGRRVVPQPPSVMSILRRRLSPTGTQEPPRPLRRTTTRVQAGSVRPIRVESPSRQRPRVRTPSEPYNAPMTDGPRVRTTSETSRIPSTAARSRTTSGLSGPPATPPPRYATRPSSRQSQSGYASKSSMRKLSSQPSMEAAPRTVTLQAPPLSKASRSPRSPNLIELVRRLSKKHVRFKSVSSRRTISSRGTPSDSPVPRPTRVIRRMPSSSRLAAPTRPPPGLSRSSPPHYQPVPAPRVRPRRSAQPPSPQEPPSVYPSHTTRSRAPSPLDARSTITRTALPPMTTARSRSRSVHRIPSSTYLTPPRPSARPRPPSPWAHSQHTFHASSSTRSTPISPLDYDSDPPTPRVKRRPLFTPFTRSGKVGPTGWLPWGNTKRSQEHAAFVDLPMGMGASEEHLPRRKGLGLFGRMGAGVPRLWKDSTYGIPVLHPFLRASTFLRASRIIWDMRYPKLPQEYSLSPFVHKSLQESTTQPPLKSMTILIPNPTRIYWSTTVRPRSGGDFVTCIDMLRAAALLLRTPATPSEFAALRPSDQRLAERAFNGRCQAGEDMGQREEERERRIGMRKVDLLGRGVVWKGLRPDKGGRGWIVALGETWI